jgi:hypothetical protein
VNDDTTIDPGAEANSPERPFKCDQCGRTYNYPGTCTGGEYPHPPVELRPTEDVLADAEPEAAVDVAAEPPPQTPEQHGGVFAGPDLRERTEEPVREDQGA